MERLVVIKKNAKCRFCGIVKNDCLKYGPIYKIEKIIAHYYCVLLSNRLIQNGNDDEGMLGFLLSDIKKELQRTENILCHYCHKGHANISCGAKKCKRNFHLPCGLKFGSSHQFLYDFKSFCHTHQLIQHIPEKILKEGHKTAVCCICYEKVIIRNRKSFLWAPCCLKTWYHRICIQKLALSAGYFFRCAACNDVKKFNNCMQKNGIFIPQQDASWELVPNAYEELLFRYNSCDADECKCTSGRQHNKENTMWEIILCGSCGSQGIHVVCGNLKFVDPEWECPSCRNVTKKTKNVKSVEDSVAIKADEGSSKMLKLTEVLQKKRRRDSEDLGNSVLDKRKKFRTNVEDEEVEIDVETIDISGNNDETFADAVDKSESWKVKNGPEMNGEEMLSLIKPGPLSFKLSVLQKVLGDVSVPKQGQKCQIDLIELSDSDDDVKIIEEKKTTVFHKKTNECVGGVERNSEERLHHCDITIL